MKTYDEMVVDTLREIEPVTMKTLSEKLGYKTTQACFHLIKNLIKSGKIVKDTTIRPYLYKTNKGGERKYGKNNVKRRIEIYEL